MGLFDHLFLTKKGAVSKESASQTTDSFQSTFSSNGGHNAEHKNLRLERRELLYSVVRESMARLGILSSSYKYKVLSLEPRGRQYMIMVDFSADVVTEVVRLAEIESVVTQNAKMRHDIIVTAVYWRIANQTGGNRQAKAKESARPAIASSVPEYETEFQSTYAEPSPIDETSYQPTPPSSTSFLNQSTLKTDRAQQTVQTNSLPNTWQQSITDFTDTELQLPDGPVAPRLQPRIPTLPREFQDTETIEIEEKIQPLSTTQYGDLN